MSFNTEAPCDLRAQERAEIISIFQLAANQPGDGLRQGGGKGLRVVLLLLLCATSHQATWSARQFLPGDQMMILGTAADSKDSGASEPPNEAWANGVAPEKPMQRVD